MSHRRVEACDSWRPPPVPGHAPALLLRAGNPWGRSCPPCAFASLSVREGGAAAVKAEDVGEEKERTLAQVAAEVSGTKGKMPPVAQLLKHPLALLALVPSSVALFAAGAGAGAVAKTVTAPLDRVKLLMQTHSVRMAGESTKGIGFVQAMAEIGKEEGIKGYWKGNLPQVIRIIPYSAVQLFSYEVYKKVFRRKDGELTVFGRLAAGACAGMTSTLVTYPLDVLRLRLAVQSGHSTMSLVALNMLREEGLASFYGGLGPSLIGIAPYIAVNFCVFDLMKKSVPEKYKSRPETSLATALLSATFATLMCYPLDTVRRQMQMKGTPYNTIFDAIPGS
ncbi:hypothetical protein VPH35_059462 [Triticum aestivum]|uniref:Uncharacterized protein n=1 Tax=Aegilops tauschii subsp. strangulata TaxID=200361 RepID=A0A453EP06_AEGTS